MTVKYKNYIFPTLYDLQPLTITETTNQTLLQSKHSIEHSKQSIERAHLVIKRSNLIIEQSKFLLGKV